MTEASTIRLRMSARDPHYGGALVAGATILGIFGDIATELAIRHDGDEGLLKAYENVEFLAPVYAGDFVEATGKIIEIDKNKEHAVVDYGDGTKRKANITLVNAKIGDYVLVHAGFAIELLNEKEAEETLNLFREMLSAEEK